jgi:hypothetical protein
MPSIESIIKSKIALIENSPNRFVTRVEAAQEQLLKDALKLIGELDTKDGLVVASESNFAKIEQISQQLQGVLNNGEYLEATKDIIADMDKAKVLNDSYFKKAVPEYKVETRLNQIYNANRTSSINTFIGETTLEAEYLQPLKEALLSGISNEMPFSELVTNITTLTVGNEEVEGKLKKYGKQIASTTFSQTERNYGSMVADELGVEFVRYVGGEIDTTRCFCEQRNGKYFHIEEVRAWGDGDLSAGGLDMSCNTGGGAWAGMIDGTNRGNIESNLGGWECKHSLVYVSEINVPQEVIDRAIAAGYFKQ